MRIAPGWTNESDARCGALCRRSRATGPGLSSARGRHLARAERLSDLARRVRSRGYRARASRTVARRDRWLVAAAPAAVPRDRSAVSVARPAGRRLQLAASGRRPLGHGNRAPARRRDHAGRADSAAGTANRPAVRAVAAPGSMHRSSAHVGRSAEPAKLNSASPGESAVSRPLVVSSATTVLSFTRVSCGAGIVSNEAESRTALAASSYGLRRAVLDSYVTANECPAVIGARRPRTASGHLARRATNCSR